MVEFQIVILKTWVQIPSSAPHSLVVSEHTTHNGRNVGSNPAGDKQS